MLYPHLCQQWWEGALSPLSWADWEEPGCRAKDMHFGGRDSSLWSKSEWKLWRKRALGKLRSTNSSSIPWESIKMQILRPLLRPTDSVILGVKPAVCVLRALWVIWSTQKFESHCPTSSCTEGRAVPRSGKESAWASTGKIWCSVGETHKETSMKTMVERQPPPHTHPATRVIQGHLRN